MINTNDALEKIIELAAGLKSSVGNDEDKLFVTNFDALELPEIIASIVDHLQPQLLPYEAAIYWYMFRNSVMSTGTQYVRVSTRGMSTGVILPSLRGGRSEGLSYASVQTALQGLEEKGAIEKAGDTNRDGTPFKVHLPEEIAICQESMKAQPDVLPEVDTEKELDYYNNRENRLRVFARDDYICHYCRKQLTRFSATLDHIQPVSEGGDNSLHNLVTSCLHCNSNRGSKPVSDFIEEEANKSIQRTPQGGAADL